MGRVTRSSAAGKTQKEVPVKKPTASKKKKKTDAPAASDAPEVTVKADDVAGEKTEKEIPVEKAAVSKEDKTPDPPAASDTPEVSKTDDVVSSDEKVVTVEACKQWGAFKSRAAKIQKAVGKDAIVEINKEKPGRGNFIITISGVDDAIVDLKGLKRPFPALKALNMDDVISKVLAAVKG